MDMEDSVAEMVLEVELHRLVMVLQLPQVLATALLHPLPIMEPHLHHPLAMEHLLMEEDSATVMGQTEEVLEVKV